MNNIFGSKPVSGDDFYGRIEFINHLKRILQSKNSFLLLGLRRTGKSSSLEEVCRLLRIGDKEIEIVSLNCQTYNGIEDFYKNLFLSLPKSWREKFRNVLKDSKRIPSLIIDYITDHVEEINIGSLGSVKLRNEETIRYSNAIKEEVTNFFKKSDKHIVLIIDELPFLFENINNNNSGIAKREIEMILTTLRAWREIGISQAICGSINLHIQLEKLDVSKKLLGGIISQTLPKFTEEEARGLINKLGESKNLKFDNTQLDVVLKLIPDFIPQFLQYFFFCIEKNPNIDSDCIKSIYNKQVYPVIIKDFENQFNERLKDFRSEDYIVSKKILNTILKKGKLSESELLNSIKSENAHAVFLNLLYQEFLVIDEDQRVDFSFEIVRAWWRKKSS